MCHSVSEPSQSFELRIWPDQRSQGKKYYYGVTQVNESLWVLAREKEECWFECTSAGCGCKVDIIKAKVWTPSG